MDLSHLSDDQLAAMARQNGGARPSVPQGGADLSYLSDDQLSQLAQKQAKPDPTLYSEGLAVASEGNKGLAEMLGAPVDLMNTGIGMAGEATGLWGASPEPFLGSAHIKGMLKDGGMIGPEPQTTAGRIIGKGAKFVGANAVPMGAAMTLERSAVPAINGVTGAIRNAFAANPGAQTAVAAGSGLGAGVANEIAPDSLAAELTGALAGGGVTAFGPTLLRAIKTYGVDMVRAVLEPLTKNGQNQIVGRALTEMSGDPATLALRLEQALTEGDIVPGSQPTTAQALQDAGLATAERGVASSSPQNAAAFAARSAEQGAARRTALNDIAPGGGGAESVASFVRGRIAQFEGGTQDVVNAATQKATQRLEALGGNVSREDAGAIIREEYTAALKDMKGQVHTAYDGIDPTGDATLPMTGTIDDIQTGLAKYFGEGSGGAGPDVQALVADVNGATNGGKQAVSYSTAQNIRSRAREMAGKARLAGDNRQAAFLERVAHGIDSDIESTVARTEWGQFVDDFTAGNLGNNDYAMMLRGNPALMERLAQETGKSIEELNGMMGRFDRVQHTLNRHGPESADRWPVTPEDLKLAPDVARHGKADYIGANAQGQPEIRRVASQGDSEYTMTQTIHPQGKKSPAGAGLFLSSLRKRHPLPKSPETGSPRPNVQDVTGSTSSIPSDLPTGNFTADQSRAWREAASLRRDQGNLFEQGASGRVGGKERMGSYKLADGEVAGAYFNGTKAQGRNADQFVQALGGRERAVQALKDFAVNDLRAFATRVDGSLDPKKFMHWLNRHAGALNNFPELQGNLFGAKKAQALVDGMVGRQKRTLQEVQRSALGFFLKRNPDDAIAGILKGKDSARALSGLVRTVKRDNDALAGLRRAVVEQIQRDAATTATDAAGESVMSTAKFINSVRSYEGALLKSGLFEPGHIAAIRNVAADMERAAFSNTAGRGVGSNTMQNMSTGGLLTRITLGAVDPGGVVSQIASRGLQWVYSVPSAQIQELLTEALLDPKIARELVKKATPRNVEKIGSALRERYATTASVAIQQAQQDQAANQP